MEWISCILYSTESFMFFFLLPFLTSTGFVSSFKIFMNVLLQKCPLHLSFWSLTIYLKSSWSSQWTVNSKPETYTYTTGVIHKILKMFTFDSSLFACRIFISISFHISPAVIQHQLILWASVCFWKWSTTSIFIFFIIQSEKKTGN